MAIRRDCILWSGGKDSFLAYLLSRNESANACIFVTFVPRRGFFRCHPLPILQKHGSGLAVTHEFIVIDENSWLADYSRAFAFLKEYYGVVRVISGDILSSSTLTSYWITGVPHFEIALEKWICLLQDLAIEFVTPLSGLYAEEIIDSIELYQMRAVVTGLSNTWYAPNLLGRSLNRTLLKSTSFYNNPAFDLCGERGEYHTTVMSFGDQTYCDLEPSGLGSLLLDGVWSLDWDRAWLDPPLKRHSV